MPNSERILIADDDATFLALVSQHLQRQGYKVEGFPDGLAALERLKAAPGFALLVADLDMPRLDGLELLRAARELDPHLEVVIVTGNSTLDVAIAALREAGAYDFLVKPLETLQALSVAVERALAHRRLVLEREALLTWKAAEAERLEALIATTGDAILAADAHGTLTVMNPAAARLLKSNRLVGYDASASLPRPLAMLLDNWQALGQGRPLSLEVPGPDLATWLVSLTPVAAHGGWVMVIRDITLLKRLDELKFHLLAETANKLQLPLAQAIGDIAELGQRLPAGDTQAASIAYRLTTLWTRIQDWMGDLLALMRIEAGVGARPVELSLSTTLAEIVRHLPDKSIRAKGLSISLQIDPDLPRLCLDPDLLRHLVQALVKRAILRSERGGQVSFLAQASQGQVWLQVADDGPAVSADELPHLFEKSPGRVNLTQDEPGLELAMAKSVADRLGGQVWLPDRGAVGSTIAVCLPIQTSSERRWQVEKDVEPAAVHP
jgi:CheY-like chemotaxis protein/nitrogen-specific signal transduction histidine kinase